MEMESTPQRTPVVTAFVYHGGEVALVKRSDRVKTYQGKWAAFSGYVEHAPLQQAYIELAEEAALSESQVKLMGIGIPLEVDDDRDGSRWLVLPFIFKLEEGAKIEIDWEAEGIGWFTADDIESMDTVPGLSQALKRVWPVFGSEELWRDLGAVAMNTREGATELARLGLEALGRFVQGRWDTLDHRQLVRVIRGFAATRPVMGVFPDLAARLLLGMEREGGEFQLDALITEMIGEINDATALSVDAVGDALQSVQRLFTVSYSEAVREAIMNWESDDSVVIIAESAPRLEGIALGENLADHGINVETVADADIAAAVETADAVLVGCDSITGTKEVINKVGTRAAVEAANKAGIPSYAIAETIKIAPPEWPIFLEPEKFEEEGKTPHGAEKVFDLTPFSGFQAVFTEEGALSAGRLSEIQSDLGSVQLIPAR